MAESESTPQATTSSSQSEASTSLIACLVCRSRKVRCDKTIPECQNCTRLGLPCPGYDPQNEFISRKEVLKSAETIFKAAGVEKRRVGSCEECRSSKHRCTRTRPSCRRCVLRDLPCRYPSKDRDSPSLTAVGLTSEPADVSPAGNIDGVKAISAGLVGLSPSDAMAAATRSRLAAEFGVDIDSLCTETLPNDHGLRLRLIHIYFQRAHHLHTLSFIHKPTFLQSFENGNAIKEYGEPLLYGMCALGARHLYFDVLNSIQNLEIISYQHNVPGRAWAERARKEVLIELHAPTIYHIMSVVLVCEYAIREDQMALVFILISVLHRTIRLLGLDVPRLMVDNPSTPQLTQRESENRLVWTCFFYDVFIGNGVEKNMCWKGHVPEIPLPRPEECFINEIPSLPLFLQQVEEQPIALTIQNLNSTSLLIIGVRIRSRVMQLIRVNDPMMPIWEPMSEFSQIISRTKEIYQNLPENYRFTPENIPWLREQGLLGTIFALHFLLNAIIFDLTRLSLPGFNFPLAPAFENAPLEFRASCQELCRQHANEASNLIRMGLGHGPAVFDDVFCADATVEKTKIEIIHSATVDSAPLTLQTTRENIICTLNYLLTFHTRGNGAQQHFIRLLLPLCHLFGYRDIAERYQETVGLPIDPIEIKGSEDNHHLSAVTPFRRGRTEIQGSQSKMRSEMSSSSSGSVPLLQHAIGPLPPPDLADLGQGEENNNMAPPLSSLLDPMAQILGPITIQRNPLQIMPSAGVMLQDGAMLQPSMDDYIKTAEEMSAYLIGGWSGDS